MSEPKADIVKQALDRFQIAAQAEEDQRDREIEDLKFQIPELQWPAEVKAQRGSSTVNGVPIPPRPMLSIPKLDQPIQLVLNQERQAQLGLTIHALDEEADDDTAEVIQGLYRRIEVDSRADLARGWAFDRAVKAGRGFYRILTEPDPTGKQGDQRIVIKRILYQSSVYLDPFATEPDWSDAGWAIIGADLPYSRYRKQFPKSKLATFSHEEFRALGDDAPGWVNGEGEARTVRIAEYFVKEYDEQGQPTSVKWYKLNAVEVLDKGEWNGRYIPIVPVIGKELQPFDGERRWVGIIGPAKDGQRLFNYAASAAVEVAALEPKAPWIIAEGQEEGHEQEFLLSNVRNLPYIRYKPTELAGKLVERPDRVRVDTSRLGPSMELLQQADSFIQAATTTVDQNAIEGMAKRKVAHQTINAIQQQSDYGTSHYLDNLATVSLTYESKVILDALPNVYDRPERVVRTLGRDDTPGQVMLNQPYIDHPDTKQPTPAQPGQPVPMSAQGMPGKAPKVKHFDLRKGRYGVVASVGKSYKTKAMEGADALTQIFQADPQAMPLLLDLWLKFQDFPGHEEAAERAKRMVPPQALGEENGPDPKQMQAKMQHAMQMVEMLTKELNAKNKIIETEQVKESGKVEIEKVNAELQLKLQAMKNAAAIRIKEIDAATKGYQTEAVHQQEHEIEALNRTHEHVQNELDRRHDAGMAAMGAQAGADQSAQDHQEALEAGDQSHQQALEQGEQGHGQAMEQAEQQADLAPEPSEGA